jgi:hypothetical protein
MKDVGEKEAICNRLDMIFNYLRVLPDAIPLRRHVRAPYNQGRHARFKGIGNSNP